MESILNTLKKPLGVPIEMTNFDDELIMHINSALMSVQQLGIGPITGFSISSSEDIWEDLLGDRLDLEGVKTYLYLKVRLVFDPPQNSFLVEAIKSQITELESRLNTQAEGGPI